jgi:DNA-binding protein HU-beta
MAKMTKNQLIDAIAEGTQVSKADVKAVIEQMATVGYKELNESGEFVIPGFVKMSVVNKPATEARTGVNPFTKEPMEFAAKPASKQVSQGFPPEGCQRRCLTSSSEWKIAYDKHFVLVA